MLSFGALWLCWRAARRRLLLLRRGEAVLRQCENARILIYKGWGRIRNSGILALTPTRLLYVAWGPAFLGFDMELPRPEISDASARVPKFALTPALHVVATGDRSFIWQLPDPATWAAELAPPPAPKRA